MQIENSLVSPALSVAVLTDPDRIEAYKVSVAGQMNDQSGGPVFTDLSERIADVVIETSVQGASFLEVHVIDPARALTLSGFIQCDEDGFLYPPIEIEFPHGTDQVWRLVQLRDSKDPGTANIILMFEDKIASVLRDVDAKNGGVRQGVAGETLGGFIKRLVNGAERAMATKIRLVELIAPADPNYSAPISAPSSAGSFNQTTPQGGGRKNPNKVAGGLTPSQQQTVRDATGAVVKQTVASISGFESSFGVGLTGADGWAGL